MANLNKVLLMGNLTRDPEQRSLPSGSVVCEMGMATNRRWRDSQSGEMREQVCFVDVVAYGRQAETLLQYMSKGRPLFVEGRLDFQSWKTQEGQTRSKLRVVVEQFQFIGGRDDANGGGGGGGGMSASRRAPAAAAAPAAPAAPQRNMSNDAPPDGIILDEDDIPF